MSIPPTIERQKNGRVICTVAFTAEQTAASEEKALRKIGSSIRIDGFRDGTAPIALLREKIDTSKLFEETVRELLPDTFTALVQEHSIHPIIPPKVEITNNAPVTVKVTFVERPPVKVKKASKLSVQVQKAAVGEEDVQKMIDYILRQHQKTEEALRAAKGGDRVTMDFWGESQDGKEVGSIRTTGHQVVIGSKVLLPGFEDALIGMQKGDTKNFTLTFPEKHQAEALRGKPVTFHVTVQKVEAISLPELTDAFAKEHLQVESVAELKRRVREPMEKREEELQRRKAEEEAFEKIREATTVELVPELVADEKEALLDDLAEQLKRQNMGFEEWMKRTGKTAEQMEEELSKQAEKRLTLRLGISTLIEEKAIDISDEEMRKGMDSLLSPLSVEERLSIAPAYAKGEKAYEQLQWQMKVDKLLEEIIQE